MLALLILPVFAQSDASFDIPQNIGTTPDSPFYFFDVLFDDLRYNSALSENEKARIGISIAEERLLEIKAMLNKDQIENAMKAESEHKKVLEKVEKNLGDSDGDSAQDVENELDENAALRERLGMHKINIEDVKLKVKARLTSNLERLSANEHANLEKVTFGLENAVQRVDLKLENEKSDIKQRLVMEFHKPVADIDNKITKIEREMNERLVKERNSGY